MGEGWTGDTGSTGHREANLENRSIHIWDCQHRELSQRVTWKSRLDWVKEIKSRIRVFVFWVFWDPLTLPALLVGLQLVTPRMGHPGSCTGEPDTKEYERRIHLHVSHSTEGRASSVSQNLLPSTLWSTLLPWDILLCPAEELMKREESGNNRIYAGLFYGLRGKHPTVLNLHSGKSNFD